MLGTLKPIQFHAVNDVETVHDASGKQVRAQMVCGAVRFLASDFILACPSVRVPDFHTMERRCEACVAALTGRLLAGRVFYTDSVYAVPLQERPCAKLLARLLGWP